MCKTVRKCHKNLLHETTMCFSLRGTPPLDPGGGLPSPGPLTYSSKLSLKKPEMYDREVIGLTPGRGAIKRIVFG